MEIKYKSTSYSKPKYLLLRWEEVSDTFDTLQEAIDEMEDRGGSEGYPRILRFDEETKHVSPRGNGERT